MLHTETVEAGTLALIKRLSGDAHLKDFVLVGGTALALQLGHRKSIDIDFFTADNFDVKGIAKHFDAVYDGKDITVLGNAVFSRINGIKVDLLKHAYPWLKPPKEIDGIRMASLEDIGAMKLHAIVNSGTRLKDYYDIHYLLEDRNLRQLLDAYEVKYPEANSAIAKNALLYHKEIDFEPGVDLVRPGTKWNQVEKRLKEAVTEPRRVFPKMEADRTEEPLRKLRKGRRR